MVGFTPAAEPTPFRAIQSSPTLRAWSIRWSMEKNSGRAFTFSSYVFETRSGELTRAGKRIRIPDQAARLSALLLENPGTVVSRDQLRRELWPEGQLQDYDHSIHRVVSQLREILRDPSSKSTQLIETLPKRGYRLSGSVEEIPSLLPSAVSPAEIPAPAVDERGGLLPPPPFDVPARLPEPKRSLARKTIPVIAIAGAILLLLGAGSLAFNRWVKQPAPPLSLGIIPFESSGPDAAPIAESFRLNLADVLSQSPAIETRALHSFDHIGSDETQILSRAQKLGVEVLLFGRFKVAGSQCELHLELVRSRDDVHLGSFQYSGNLQELAAISDRVERDIFERLYPSRKAINLNSGRPASINAYEAYLRGRGYLKRWTDDDLRQAVEAFKEAIKEDPSYARAYAGLASAYFVLSQHDSKEGLSNLDKCHQYAAKAISLDPDLAEAHAMLGQAALNRDWNFSQAAEELHRAVELDPDHAIYHQWLAILYGLESKYGLSLKEIDKAQDADPNWAPLYMTEIFLADIADNHERANLASDRLLQMMPSWSLAHEQCAMSLWGHGDYARAISEWRQAAVLEKNVDRIHLEDAGAEAFKKGGVAAYARLRLHAIATRKGISHEEQDFVPAEWHAYAGEWDKTIAELNQSIAERSPSVIQIYVNGAYKPIHNDPRFIALIKRIGIPLPDSNL